MKIKLDYIENLSNFMTENGLCELSLDDGNEKIALKKHTTTKNVSAQKSSAPIVEELVEEEIVDTRRAITAPMVGTFYKASSQSEPPFVQIGTEIKKGDVVCIIEAMKLMNEIESEYEGKVVEICVENARPVEFGQVLMYIE